jgi:serine/threonine kinase 16
LQLGTLQDDLECRLKTKNYLSTQRVLHLFHNVCTAVDAMHSLQPPIAHCDIKVANVLLSDDDRAVLMDLGSARPARVTITDRRHAQQVADTAAEHCTMTYRAPELFNVEPDMILDERVDVWVRTCACSHTHTHARTVTRLSTVCIVLFPFTIRHGVRTR